MVAIKTSNVQQVISEARVEGTSQEALNGKVAASAVYDLATARYVVEGLSERPLSIRPEHLILPPGTRVSIHGVQSRAELNGQPGKIVGSDGKERYTVELAGGEQVRLKFGVVVPLHAGGMPQVRF